MQVNKDRRNTIIKALQGVGIFVFSGFLWSAYISKAKANGYALRPPGAKKESEFLKLCIKCGRCVTFCPYDTLKLAKIEDSIPLGTPYFTPREIPCYMCVDIPCVPVCPTNALDPALLSITENGKEMMNIRNAKMGVAIVDDKNCVAYWGIQCDACYRACPLIDEAIRLEYKHNDRTNKHSFLLPVVDSDICTGCGLCERACITDKAAIMVLPLDKVLGSVGTNYIKGWDKNDEKRLKKLDSSSAKASDIKNAIDYLNTESL
ncbi:ferredoxin-type protein NapG [Helicobacter sp. MIT 14-3879]|uniref:ferredoxin-type protein NapG n=1 Tax=Helicobacter sp. MIT 14-3879 TaxID=2040649 RepID=UPI000E1EFC40|nr:ferredoxin-type protein NapG [Helicobacter sp. MIT 14-3879]RDU63481.1 ferredoxin-type protein NapG [Helicobacter sp. MIT 14-3879]